MEINKNFYRDTFSEMFISLNQEKSEIALKLESDCKILRKELSNLN